METTALDQTMLYPHGVCGRSQTYMCSVTFHPLRRRRGIHALIWTVRGGSNAHLPSSYAVLLRRQGRYARLVATDGIDPSSCAYETLALPLSYAAAVVLGFRIERFFLGSQPSVSPLHLSQHIWTLRQELNLHFRSSYHTHRS